MDIQTEILPFDSGSIKDRKDEKENHYRELGSQILYTCRNEICARFPFFSAGIAALSCEITGKVKPTEALPSQEIHGIGTNGSKLLAEPLFLIRTWAKNPGKLKRGYLHILFHCLYLHPFYGERVNERLWKVACDLAAELLLKANLPEKLWEIPAREKKPLRKYWNILVENHYQQKFYTAGWKRKIFRFL